MIAELTSAALDVSNVTPALSAIGSLGFAIWFAYYTTTVTLPSQQKEHREQIRELSETHAATVKELVTEMRSGRESFDRWRTATDRR